MKAIEHNNLLYYFCPGCDRLHSVPPQRWNWNGSLDKPTLSPSVRHFITWPEHGEETICHYFIRDGKIEYCGDCPHKFSGQTLELPDIRYEDKEYLGIS